MIVHYKSYLPDLKLDPQQQKVAIVLGSTVTGLFLLNLYRGRKGNGITITEASDLLQYDNASAIRGALALVFPPTVSVINVVNSGLRHVPSPVFTLTRLTKLNLSGNNIKSIPKEIRRLTALIDLDLGNNKLTSVPEEIGSLKQLKFLNLMNNELESLPESIGQLKALHRLGLKGNKLKSLPDSFSQLESLVELFLTDNEIEEFPPGMENLKALVKVQASHNALVTLPDGFGSLPNLELFRVACCNISKIPPALANSSSLTWFSLASNPASKLSNARGISVPKIPISDLQIGPKIGDGASGEVFDAIYQGRRVAFKIFLAERSPDGHSRDERAIATSMHHPNLVHILALVDEPLGMVMRFVDAQPLAQKPTSQSLLRCRWTPGTRFTLPFVLSVAHGVASALEALHARGIAHGDVYAHNVLADVDGNAVLCDYGASFVYTRSQSPQAAMFEGQEVRAFGLMLRDMVERLDIGFEGMEQAIDCQKQLLLMIQQATTGLPAKRPTFSAIVKKLSVLQKTAGGRRTPRSDTRAALQRNGDGRVLATTR